MLKCECVEAVKAVRLVKRLFTEATINPIPLCKNPIIIV